MNNGRSSNSLASFNASSLNLNVQEETDRIVEFLQQTVNHRMRRYGAVVGISGGIDSSLVLALCVRAFGPEHVIGLAMPERESSPESVKLARSLADCYGVEMIVENLTSALEGAGCYQRRDEAICRVFPNYQPGWKAKIVLPADLLDQATLNVFRLAVSDLEGHEFSKRVPPQEFNQIVAASNLKQRTRMSTLYYHAELRNYAVIGTANKNEYDLGFFVKYGDGGADVAPIEHLFKTQVFQLAKYLGIPEEIQARTPTTDTYPGGSTQEEFFYRIPFHILDAVWLGYEQGLSDSAIASGLSLTTEQVHRVIADIASKQRATAYLRSSLIGIND